MLKKDLILKSPVSKTIGFDNIRDGKFGAVLSRAGVGKTSFLVQIALTQLLNDNKILHISQVFKYSIVYILHTGHTLLYESI